MKLSNKVAAVALVAATSLFGATAAHAADIANPQGQLLDTVTATIPASPNTLDLNNSAGWLTDGNLAGNSDCNLNNDGPERVYVGLTIKINKAGHYTFRIVGQDPAFGGDTTTNPISDPYLALYQNFNTSDLDAGVVGCNDDAATSSFLSSNPWVNGDTFPTNGESNTNDRWSHFEADLQPGTYTAVLTTWSQITAADYNSSFAPESATFEYWGPECGIETSACASSSKKKLATTGSNSNETLFAGIALLVAGASVVRSRRRSAQK